MNHLSNKWINYPEESGVEPNMVIMVVTVGDVLLNTFPFSMNNAKHFNYI